MRLLLPVFSILAVAAWASAHDGCPEHYHMVGLRCVRFIGTKLTLAEMRRACGPNVDRHLTALPTAVVAAEYAARVAEKWTEWTNYGDDQSLDEFRERRMEVWMEKAPKNFSLPGYVDFKKGRCYRLVVEMGEQSHIEETDCDGENRVVCVMPRMGVKENKKTNKNKNKG